MKKGIITLSFLLMSGIVSAQENKVSYVNPMIGTVKMGHTFPGACVPHGIVQLSPDTDTIPHSINGVYQKDTYKYCAGYQYDDKIQLYISFKSLDNYCNKALVNVIYLIIPRVY